MKHVEDLNTEFAKSLHGIKSGWIHWGDARGFSCVLGSLCTLGFS